MLSSLDTAVASAFSKVTYQAYDDGSGLDDADDDDRETDADGESGESGESGSARRAEYADAPREEDVVVPAAPDFAALAPASLAPPTGRTLDHGMRRVACSRLDASGSEDRPDMELSDDAEHAACLPDDLFASAAEARGAWAAAQLRARVSHLVGARDARARRRARRGGRRARCARSSFRLKRAAP